MTDEVVVNAPTKPGEYTWTVALAAVDKQGVLHQANAKPFSFLVKPHTTSMALWDVPSPVEFDSRFKLKVGVQCSAKPAENVLTEDTSG